MRCLHRLTLFVTTGSDHSLYFIIFIAGDTGMFREAFVARCEQLAIPPHPLVRSTWPRVDAPRL